MHKTQSNLEKLVETVLLDFSEEELRDEKLMLAELKTLLGVSEQEAFELLTLARLKLKTKAALVNEQ